MLFAELVLVNAVAPQRSLVLATNPMSKLRHLQIAVRWLIRFAASLDVYAVGLYNSDPMWDDYNIAPSDGALKGLAAVHIIAGKSSHNQTESSSSFSSHLHRCHHSHFSVGQSQCVLLGQPTQPISKPTGLCSSWTGIDDLCRRLDHRLGYPAKSSHRWSK